MSLEPSCDSSRSLKAGMPHKQHAYRRPEPVLGALDTAQPSKATSQKLAERLDFSLQAQPVSSVLQQQAICCSGCQLQPTCKQQVRRICTFLLPARLACLSVLDPRRHRQAPSWTCRAAAQQHTQAEAQARPVSKSGCSLQLASDTHLPAGWGMAQAM